MVRIRKIVKDIVTVGIMGQGKITTARGVRSNKILINKGVNVMRTSIVILYHPSMTMFNTEIMYKEFL